MSGWIAIIGDTGSIDYQVNRFKKIFNVDGVPNLKYTLQKYSAHSCILSWMWGHSDIFPDLTIVENKKTGQVILLDGLITDMGKFGPADVNSKLTSQAILKFWNTEGEKFIEELNGTFALVIIDYNKAKTISISDRIASRSIWYSATKKTQYFGNFPSAVAAVYDEPLHLDAAALWSLIATSRPVGNHSIYEELKSLQAGQVGYFHNNNKMDIKNWYELRYQPDNSFKHGQCGEMLADKLKTSAERIIHHSPTSYLFLSGGMDSRVAAAAFGEKIKTITLTTERNMNSRISEKVAATLNIKHKTVLRDPYWYLDSFEAAALISGGNYNISHAHFIKPVQEIVEEDPEASFLLGDMLENFNKHYFKPIFRTADDIKPEKIPGIFNHLYSFSHKHRPEVKQLFQSELGEKCHQSWSQGMLQLAESVTRVSTDHRDYMDALFRWSNTNFCPTYLMFDCIKPLAKINNLMFNNDLLDVLFKIPAEIKSKDILHNLVLKNLNKRLLYIPNSNFWLPPIFPGWAEKMTQKIRPILGKTRRKFISIYKKGPIIKTEGSWHMNHVWYRKDSKYREFISDILFDKRALPDDIFNRNYIKKIWYQFQNGDISRVYEINVLLSFGLLNKKIASNGIRFS